MKKLYFLTTILPSLFFAQIAIPNGQVQSTANPETGNVGIGTSSPDQKFVVDFNSEQKKIKFFQPPYNTGSTLVSSLMYTWYGNHTDIGMVRGNAEDIKGLAFRFNGEERMRLSSNGNLGLGTNDPQAKLNIYGGHGDTTLLLHSFGNGGDAPAYLNLWASEPGSTYNGTGIGNNIRNYPDGNKAFGRFNPQRGGSYIRLLENSILFSTVDNSGAATEAIIIGTDGNVAVSNKLEAKEVKISNTPTADFVFAEDYNLPKLEEVEKHIKENKHLPEIASAKEMEKEGVNVGEFQIKLLQKIEELTLYTIEQNKQLKLQQKEIQSLKTEIQSQKK